MNPRPTAMFPLGTVLLPGELLPLQIFEPRYVEMIRRQLAADDDLTPTFGVVLIERGTEVGGGDQRSKVATMANAEGLAVTADGRYVFGAVGTDRVRVVDWLDDDPFPRAITEPWPLEGSLDRRIIDDLVGRIHEIADDLTAAGQPHPEIVQRLADTDFSAGAADAVYALTSTSPLGASDRYRVLAAADVSDAADVLASALDDVGSVLKFYRS